MAKNKKIRPASGAPATTADALFAECWGHSAKPAKQSAKALPSAALGKDFIGKNFFAECQKSTLDKVFAECQARTRQKITAVNI